MFEGIVIKFATSKQKGTSKQARDSVVFVRGFGIEGDAHAGDGTRQVSLLSFEDIREMEGRMGRSLGFGRFGENIIVEGLGLTGVRPKDLLSLGDAVVLEVTEIGKECHFGCEIRRITGDCIMPSRGVFSRVLFGGKANKGDSIRMLKPDQDITVVILAGGLSVRFGSDKRFARIGYATLLENAMKIAREVSPNVLISVANGEGKRFSSFGQTIEDQYGRRGPIGGIVAGLSNASTPLIVFLPVDCPHIPADLLKTIASLVGDDGACIKTSLGIEPLIACFRKGALDKFLAEMEKGNNSCKEVVNSLKMNYISDIQQFGDKERILSNINYPHDLDEAIS